MIKQICFNLILAININAIPFININAEVEKLLGKIKKQIITKGNRIYLTTFLKLTSTSLFIHNCVAIYSSTANLAISDG